MLKYNILEHTFHTFWMMNTLPCLCMMIKVCSEKFPETTRFSKYQQTHKTGL